MRKSFEGLSAIVRTQLDQDPTSGHLFLFTNKRKTRLKILYWDGSGLWVMAKRLEQGTFYWPILVGSAATLTLTSEEMAALVGGLDLSVSRQREWYRR